MGTKRKVLGNRTFHKSGQTSESILSQGHDHVVEPPMKVAKGLSGHPMHINEQVIGGSTGSSSSGSSSTRLRLPACSHKASESVANQQHSQDDPGVVMFINELELAASAGAHF